MSSEGSEHISLPLPIATSISFGAGLVTDANNTNVTSTVATTIESTDLLIHDQLITLNQGSTEPIITGLAGFEIFRGNGLDTYQIVYNEATGLLQAGLSLLPPETVGLVRSDALPNTILGWSSDNRFVPSTTFSPTFAGLTLGNTINIGGQNLTFPTNVGTAGYVLTASSTPNTLEWAEGGGGDGKAIIDTGGTTKIETEATADTLTFTANSALVITADDTTTTIDNTLQLNAGLCLERTIITGTTYSALSSDMFVMFNGTADCVVSLPLSTICPGQLLLVYNNSSNNSDLTVQSSTELIDGNSTPVVLSERYDRIKMLNDGAGNWIIT